MKADCKPGELAVIKGLVRDAHLNRMIGEALCYVQPNQLWISPEGRLHQNDEYLALAVKSCGSTFDIPDFDRSLYALFDRKNLFPIRGEPGDDETLTWAGLPQDAGVTA